ncbi:hypothetical protein FEDK69T_23030 [Flavobacterium enshiense DK69]|uniref:Secretion system C-terminal sorting domain-containing protein n=1 Tax=Flavobacterium enshiense DK69 TaxID=1107311 RepID=V6SD37_9FLAO|nr:T9SS type A sorting domain-containing protein [Flavobacterium enshiense]ESU22320.1 hypothetical protein FEDK69T_23030 [Flavobacterium enshiense DK69]KGO97324.1 hypothetical protein Q767_01615 [Flavobacterium enshiense DK69]
MRTYYLLLVSVLSIVSTYTSNAQGNPQLQWVFNAVNTAVWGGGSYGSSIAVDALGNRYVAGSFQGTADFDPSDATANLTSVGSTDAFIAKYDSNGNYLWAKAFGGASGESVNSIALSSIGELYVTGYFYDTADFDPSVAKAKLTSVGDGDIFIAKYDSSGNYLWAKAMGGPGYDQGDSVAVNSSGEAYITGYFVDTVDFDPSAATANLISAGQADIFIAKYSSSGSYIWAKRIGGTENDVGNSIALNSSGQVLITGYFQNTVDFDPSSATANLTSAGSGDIFIAKYDGNGNYLWANAVRGTGYEQGDAIAVNSIGEIYVTGLFQNTVDFNPSAATANLTSAGMEDIFIAKYDSNGSYLWAKAMGGPGSDRGESLALNGSGEVHVTGSFQGTVDFDPSAAVANFTSVDSSRDIFIAKYGTNGTYLWAGAMGGMYDEGGSSLVVDNSGRVSATGYFVGTVDFDPSPGTANLTSGQGDCFVLAYTSSGSYNNALAIGGYSVYNFHGEGKSVATDAFGNVYVAGTFQGTVDFDPSASTAYWTSAGIDDIFIAKYDSSGNYLWSKAIGGTSHENVASLVVNSSGEVYITGYFSPIVDFDPSPAVANLNSSGGMDIFIAKYDSNGNYIWAKAIGGPDGDTGVYSMAINNSGELYITGIFIGNIDFDPSGAVVFLPAHSVSDTFIAKYDSNGNYLWVKGIGGPEGDIVASITLNSSGQVYITGYFADTSDFDPSPNVANLTSAGNFDIFLAKYDSNGNYLWAKAMGGTGYDICDAVVVNSSGEAYITGTFSATADFNPSTATATLTPVGGGGNLFIAKYDNNGNYIWAKAIEVIKNAFFETPSSLALNNNGDMYIAGMFQGTGDFDPSAATVNFTSVGRSRDIFIAKYSNSGNFLLGKSIGGAGYDNVKSLVMRNNDQMYVTGSFQNTCDFEPSNASGSLTTLNSGDMFLAKYLECNAVTTPTITLIGTTLTANGQAGNYQWVDCSNGNEPVPGAIGPSFTPAVPGNYAVILTVGGCASISACQTVLSIHEEEMASIVLYPNPTTGNFTVSWADALESAEIVVTDIMGKTIKTMLCQGQQEARLSLDGAAKGIYFVRLQSGQKTKQFKLVKK